MSQVHLAPDSPKAQLIRHYPQLMMMQFYHGLQDMMTAQNNVS
jgi:hypothetical protein